MIKPKKCIHMRSKIRLRQLIPENTSGISCRHMMKSLFVLITLSFCGSICTAYHLRESKVVNEGFGDLLTLDDIILTDPDLSTLATAFLATKLNGTLCQICNFTAFAPNNDAFAKLNQSVLATLLTPSWNLHLLELLSFHITFPTDDRLLTKDFMDGQELDMLNAEQITVSRLKRGTTLTSPQTSSSKIVEADILASNGVLNKVDSVFFPGFFGMNVFTLGDKVSDFSTLQELFELEGYNEKEGAYTILAPDNNAFLSMTDETLDEFKENTGELGFILANHVIPGVYSTKNLTDGLKLTTLGGMNVTVSITNSAMQGQAPTIRFNGVPASQVDILAGNGIAYRFASLVFDPDPTSDAPSFVPSDAPSNIPSIVPSNVLSNVPTPFLDSVFNIGEVYPEFTILDELFEMAGLQNLEGVFTLLAPDNDAWLALGESTLTSLRNNLVALEELLRNHLINGIVSPNMLTDGPILTTLGGLNVTVEPTVARSLFVAAQGTTFLFNGATATDIYVAANGIIYRLDSVLFDPFPINSAIPVPIPSPISVTIAPSSPVETGSPTEMSVVESTPDPTGILIETSDPTIASEPMTLEPTFLTNASTEPTSNPMEELPFCIDFVCGDGYLLRENPETRPGNDRATCCYRDGVCAGSPVGTMCSLGDIDSSLIPNPSFEEFTSCPTVVSQLFLSTTWMQATAATSDYFIGSPTCDDTWYKNGYVGFIGELPQNATDGDAFVGSIKEFGDYYEYIGACLNDPLVVGAEYTFTLDVAAATDIFIYGGDTNGETDLLCIPACDLFPIPGSGYKGNDFEILATAAPEGGLVGGADWKSITFNFVPTVNCPAIMFGPSVNQSIQPGESGSYVIYDFLNLQEGAAGVCNQQGECVPSQSFPTTTPSSRPSFPPSGFCANDDDNGCNDNNFCTTDICIEEVGCENLPVICDANEACDPIDGVCRDIESVRPCIAIIDESDNFSDEEINAKWAAFRTAFPTRPFCLLQPFEAGNVLFLPTMPDFLSDNRTTFAIVNRDEDDETLISDWFYLCGYGDLAISGIDFVGLFVDESGSMTRDTVQASLDNFFTELNNANLTYCLVFDGAENWIDPFNTLLGISGGGGDCGTNLISTSSPTDPGPSSSENPSLTPTSRAPTSLRSIEPSAEPSFAPSEFCAIDDKCNDNNFCTTDTCSPGVGCENVPLVCDENEACDPIDGLCKNVERVRPCIAVIDESDNLSEEEINANWKLFRTNFPDRPFCLLLPTESNSGFFYPTDPDFLTDPRVVSKTVNRDMGDSSFASSWFDECGYSNLATTGIDFVALFLDESGSMRRRTVKASFTKFFQDLQANDLTYCTVINDKEDWITPFNLELGETCSSESTFNPTVTAAPTAPPTITAMPTTTAFPTFQPTTSAFPTIVFPGLEGANETFTNKDDTQVPSVTETDMDNKFTKNNTGVADENSTGTRQTPNSTKITSVPNFEVSAKPVHTPSIAATTNPMTYPNLNPIPSAATTAHPERNVFPSIAPLKATARPTSSTLKPVVNPTTEPTGIPTLKATEDPTTEPTGAPTVDPTAEPTGATDSDPRDSTP